MTITISTSPLLYDEFSNFIQSSADWFSPSLKTMPDLNDWIVKMYQNGMSYYVKHEQDIIALIVAYHNPELHFIYLPYVCVHPKYQGHRITHQIIKHIETNRSEEIRHLYLEVRKDNVKALSMYQNIDFKEFEDRGDKFLMKKDLAY